jgi:hypothetical protein
MATMVGNTWSPTPTPGVWPACFLSVLQNKAGYDIDRCPPIIGMLADLCAG